jgi:type I restriction enzyme R subunit
VDLTRIAIRYGDNTDIGLERGQAAVDPLNFGAGAGLTEEEKETLSKIIEDLNDRFQTKFSEDEILVIKGMEKRLSADEGLKNQLKNGSKDAVRASFETVAVDVLQDLMDDHWKFYKKVTDDEGVSKVLFDQLFDWYYQKNKSDKRND